MSKDIRFYFKVLSSKQSFAKESNVKPSVPTKKRVKALESSDEEVIPSTPKSTKKTASKKRKVEIISSDSEDDAFTKSPKRKAVLKDSKITKTSPVLKQTNVLEIFGSSPIKQSKVQIIDKLQKSPEKKKITSTPKSKKKNKNTVEVGIHQDEDFEKTLLDLDDDILLKNMEILDKTIDESMSKPNEEKVNEVKISSSEDSSPKKRHKVEKDDCSYTDPDQERYEKKRQSAILYQKYKNRSGPAHPGSKEIPKGKPDCLNNLCFLRTGVLDSLEGEEFDNIVKEHGGRTVKAVSKKVNYLVVGVEPGPAKLEKAKGFGIPAISEDDFLDLIRTKSGMKPMHSSESEDLENSKVENTEVKSVKKVSVDKKSTQKTDDIPTETIKKEISKLQRKTEQKPPEKHPKITHAENLKPIERPEIKISENNLTWTEKYKPTDVKSIIGQQGDKSNMKKLMSWLQNWYKNHTGKNKPKLTRPSPWAKSDDGAFFKCALLSGSPGVGKTTTATLVSQHLDFDIVEFNASDTRSKKSLNLEVAQLLSTKTLSSFATGESGVSNKRVLLMDEVDGMAGNEDRGGMQELIQLIKNTNVPIICMCNDRNHPKIRSLANYCFDLRFAKPRIEQIKGAMMSICFKEGIKISSDALNEVICGTGMDIRQTLNHLSVWTSTNNTLSTEEAHKEATAAKKDTVLGPWEVCRTVFSEEEHKKMSLIDKSRLFFYDYSIGPLFVQENYLHVVPHTFKKEFLKRAADTADSISMSDIVDVTIRSTNTWSLLEVQAMFASVLPGHYMEGHVGGQINFPAWLGKNSKRNKFQRLLGELHSHTRISTSGSKLAVNLDYLTHIRNGIITPLIKEGTGGVGKALNMMKSYNLLREDLDSIIELSQWPTHKDPMAMVDSKVKAAFTRAYNKEGPALPYAVNTTSLKKKSSTATLSQEEEYLEEDEVIESDNEDNDDINSDAMIKAKKKVAAKSKKGDAGETGKGKKKTYTKTSGKKK